MVSVSSIICMKRIFSVLLRCYFSSVLPICDCIVLRCDGQLLNVTFSFLSARCIRWLGFVLIRVFCHCVIDVMLLGWVCCTRLIRTQSLSVQQASICFCLSATYSTCSRSSSIGVYKVSRCRIPNLQCVSCRPRYECRMIFPTLCLIQERWWLHNGAITRRLCFLQFSVAQVLLGLRKQLTNNFVFPTWTSPGGIINNNNNNKNK